MEINKTEIGNRQETAIKPIQPFNRYTILKLVQRESFTASKNVLVMIHKSNTTQLKLSSYKYELTFLKIL